ncbi:MAG: head-tail adaptor protein, partial [Paracoccus sp. (in: a-proteobacteria)]
GRSEIAGFSTEPYETLQFKATKTDPLSQKISMLSVVQSQLITVRASNQARRITSEWRAQINGKWFDIKEDPRETQDRAFLEMLAEG